MSVITCPCCFCHLAEYLLIRKIISHLFILDIPTVHADSGGRNRVFDNGVEQRICQIHPMLIHQIMQFRYKAESLGIALEMIKILFHLLAQHIFDPPAAKRQPGQISREPFTDRNLSEMPERRISYIVDQSRTFKYMRDIFFHLRCKSRISSEFQNILSDILPKGFSQRRDLKGMGQPRSDKITLIQRKYLRLILQPPERRASYNPVVIFFKFTSEICRF